jgi:flavin prenyltransferase
MPEKGLIVGISGASGAIYGIRLLEHLRALHIPTHLIVSRAAEKTLALETPYTLEAVRSLASTWYDPDDLAAPISSGSYAEPRGMIILPCSIKTLSALANSYNDTLLVRAADVTLKERRRLVVALRETPLHRGHLELMLRLNDMGAILFPPVPAFYYHPRTIEEVIDHSLGKMLDLFGIELPAFRRWTGEISPTDH